MHDMASGTHDMCTSGEIQRVTLEEKLGQEPTNLSEAPWPVAIMSMSMVPVRGSVAAFWVATRIRRTASATSLSSTNLKPKRGERKHGTPRSAGAMQCNAMQDAQGGFRANVARKACLASVVTHQSRTATKSSRVRYQWCCADRTGISGKDKKLSGKFGL